METKPMHGNIQDAIYVNLRKNIVNLRLEPGKGISEKDIALRYRVSRTPVREAFIRLEKEGLVRVIPQRETSVSLIDWSRVIQEFFVRESLETAVLAPFADHSGAADFALMEQIIESQNAAFTAGDYVEFVDYDDQFHHAFFEAARQDLSWDVLQNMSGHYHRVRLLSIRLNGIAAGIVGQHRKILEALKKQDIPLARELLQAHLHKLDAEEELLKGNFPAYFVSQTDEDPFNINFETV